jgi:hypothetical protein
MDGEYTSDGCNRLPPGEGPVALAESDSTAGLHVGTLSNTSPAARTGRPPRFLHAGRSANRNGTIGGGIAAPRLKVLTPRGRGSRPLVRTRHPNTPTSLTVPRISSIEWNTADKRKAGGRLAARVEQGNAACRRVAVSVAPILRATLNSREAVLV